MEPFYKKKFLDGYHEVECRLQDFDFYGFGRSRDRSVAMTMAASEMVHFLISQMIIPWNTLYKADDIIPEVSKAALKMIKF